MGLILAGIDPGLQGAAVALYPDGTSAVLRMPVHTCGKRINGTVLMAWLLAHDVDAVVVERIGARAHRNGAGKVVRNAGSEFRFAIGVGVIHGVLEGLALPYRTVQPQTWKAKVLGRDAASGKQGAIEYVQNALPHVNLVPDKCRVPQDGIADAACLAVYGQTFINWR